jgi:hypothetical protein
MFNKETSCFQLEESKIIPYCTIITSEILGLGVALGLQAAEHLGTPISSEDFDLSTPTQAV